MHKEKAAREIKQEILFAIQNYTLQIENQYMEHGSFLHDIANILTTTMGYMQDVNSYLKKDICMHSINECNVSTKGENRGIGLYNVHQIVNHYDRLFLQTTYKENVFTQHLEIQEKSLYRKKNR